MVKTKDVDNWIIDGEFIKFFDAEGEEIGEIDIAALVEFWLESKKDLIGDE